MRVLIACEESQRVCMEFRERGHEAYSCDIQKCSGGMPKWHILMDARAVINGGMMRLQTGEKFYVDKWDMIIAHPPCTYLFNAATRSHSVRMTPINWINARTLNRIEAMAFFMDFVNANCEKIAIENPVGVMNTCYRKPDQSIDPYMFSDGKADEDNFVTKKTCLWLKGLKPLEPTYTGERPNNHELFGTYKNGKAKVWEDTAVNGGFARSKTFPGIAKAMAEQWGVNRMNDLISRQAAIDELDKGAWGVEWDKALAKAMIESLPSVQPEQLTDKEQRIFLAAMGREEKVCKEVDAEMTREPYEDSLVRICHEITRKVKGALWNGK